ncbi:FHA domain protein [Alteromonadaceae bacterium Bs31]|nr:FHA domain protein [Alteromonadaceae bacterium Bs31]
MIVEIVTKSGRAMELHSFHKGRISIGRGYGNDLILQDPFMEAEHLDVWLDEESGKIFVQDKNTLNGTHIQRSEEYLPANEPIELAAGQILSLGKTHIRLVDKQQPLPAAIKLSVLEPMYTKLGSWWLTLLSALVLSALSLLAAYWAAPHSDKLLKELVQVVFMLASAIFYASLWLLVARLNNREGRFLFNVNLLLVLLVLDAIVQMLIPAYEFNLGWLLSGGYLMMLVMFLLTSGVLFISMTQTLNSKPWVALGFASVVGFLFVMDEISRSLFPPDFESAPAYNMTLVSPKYQFRGAVSEGAFLERVNASYQHYSSEDK